MTDIKALNVTDQELNIISDWVGGLSDFCEMCDGTWGIEWDSGYGRHWDRYETEELASAALDRHSDRCVEVLPQVREWIAEQEAAKQAVAQAKAAKKKAIAVSKTLGGMFPELEAIRNRMAAERRSA